MTFWQAVEVATFDRLSAKYLLLYPRSGQE